MCQGVYAKKTVRGRIQSVNKKSRAGTYQRRNPKEICNANRKTAL